MNAKSTYSSLISQPIFLVGAERSGTTLLRLMLNHHPQIAWCPESEYMVDLISAESQFPHLTDYYNYLENDFIFQQEFNFHIDRSLTYPELLQSFLYQAREKAGKPIIGATVHRHFDRLLQIWDDARFIHIIRDGRDVARSCIGMGWAGNVWTGVERWIEAEKLWQNLSKKLSPERQLTLQYETLITHPQETLTRLCDFIGVAYDSQMLTYNEDTTYKTPNPQLIQQWRRKLSDDEIRLVESRISQMLTERGYELSGLPPLSLSSIQQKQLKLQDWWGRVQFRINRYGLNLFLLDYLSRRLHLKPLQKSVKEQLDDVKKSRLK